MRPIYSYTSADGLQPFQSGDSRDKYLFTKSYVLIQLERIDQFDNKQYLNFYLRPMNGNKYAIIVYIPELVVMESLKDNKHDLMILMGCNSISELIKASSSNLPRANCPFIAKIEDFTKPLEKNHVWAIELVVNGQLSKNTFIENTAEYNTLDDSIVVLKNASDTFFEALSKFYNNLSFLSWVKKIDLTLLHSSISLFEKEECFPYFINKISHIRDENLKDALLKHKIVFQSDSNNIYPIGYELLPEDYEKEGFYLIKLDTFSDNPCFSDYFLYIQLNKVDNISSFRPSINIGEINSSISDVYNNTDYIKYAKFNPSLLKLMPTTSKIWFYSNPSHEELSLKRFVEDGDTTQYDFPADETFIKRDGDNLTFRYLLGFSIDPTNLWGKMDCILDLSRAGLIVMTEFIRYIPLYKKQVYAKAAGHFVDGATFWLNPVKKIIKWLSN